VPDDVERDLAAVRHADAVAIDVEDSPAEQAFVVEAVGIGHARLSLDTVVLMN
jgi:hypothetical protein